MNRQDIRNNGFRHGWNVASWTDLPEIGQRIPPDADWVGYGTVTEENRGDVWEMLAGDLAAADGSRPDEVQEMLRTTRKPYNVRAVFRDGAEAGIRAYWRKHYAPKRRA